MRKRRGPKKGSGTVLKRLRENSHLNNVAKINSTLTASNNSSILSLHDVQLSTTASPSNSGLLYSNTASPYAGTPLMLPRQTAEVSVSGLLGPMSNSTSSFQRPITPISRSTPTENVVDPCFNNNTTDSYYLREGPATAFPRESPRSLPSILSEQSPISFNSFSPWPLVHRTSFDSDQGENHFLSVNELASKILGPSGTHGDLLNTSMDASNMSAFPDPSQLNISGSPATASAAWLQNAFDRDAEAPQVLALSTRIGLSPALISLCISQFFKDIYPIMPVIHESTFRRRLYADTLSPDELCLLMATCAMTILYVSGQDTPSADEKKSISEHLIRHFLTARLEYDYTESLTLSAVISSLFLSVVYFEFKKLRSWWFYLREACGLAYDLNLSDDATYKNLSHASEICYRRTLALLFVTERGAGLLRNKPVTLRELSYLPDEFFDDEDPSIIAGFRCLCRLFALVDAEFFKLWNAKDPSHAEAYLSAPHISRVQDQLASLAMRYSDLPEVQRADVMVTQQWLKLIYWQGAMRQGMVHSSAQNEAFQYEFPIKVARSLCEVLRDISLEAVLVHGLGIFEKLFEIAYSLMDALTLSKVPLTDSDDLKILFSYLSASSVSHDTYVRILVTKLDGHKAMQSLHGQKLLQSTDLPATKQRRR